MKKFLTTIFISILIFTATTLVGCCHNHNYKITIIEPSQTTNGYTRHYCDCGNSYNDSFTCLLTFESTYSSPEFNPAELPQIAPIIVPAGTLFKRLQPTTKFKVANYINVSLEQEILNSTNITLVWQPLSQTEKDLLNTINKIDNLCTISQNYSSVNVLLRAFQYIRTAKYTSNAWNIICGTLDSNFLQFVEQNQNNTDVKSLRSTNSIISPITNTPLDFIHMFGVINSIEFAKNINSNGAELAGWAGDLCTLVQEIVESNTSGADMLELIDQKFNGNNSTFGSQDLIANLDAVNIMQKYYDNYPHQTFSQVLIDYYLYTTPEMQKKQFLQSVFKKNYSTPQQLATDIFQKLKNNLLITYFCNTLNINFITHETQFLACANALATYFFE